MWMTMPCGTEVTVDDAGCGTIGCCGPFGWGGVDDAACSPSSMRTCPWCPAPADTKESAGTSTSPAAAAAILP